VEHEHRPDFTFELTTLPDHAKGGELVLKLFAYMQAFAADAAGVVLAVITLAVIAAITLLSDNVRSAIENVAGILP
jgi:Flp pilus assembly pilin Flp